MENDSNKRGQELEDRVETLLRSLESEFPKDVLVLAQPEIRLQNGQIVRPDFDLRVTLPHEQSWYLVECQNRAKSSNDLLHKIQQIRTKSSRKTVLFVHGQPTRESHWEYLEAEGVLAFPYEEFEGQFIPSLRSTLRATTDIARARTQLRIRRDPDLSTAEGLFDAVRRVLNDRRDDNDGPQIRKLF